MNFPKNYKYFSARTRRVTLFQLISWFFLIWFKLDELGQSGPRQGCLSIRSTSVHPERRKYFYRYRRWIFSGKVHSSVKLMWLYIFKYRCEQLCCSEIPQPIRVQTENAKGYALPLLVSVSPSVFVCLSICLFASVSVSVFRFISL